MKRIALTLLMLVLATGLFAQTADPNATEKPKRLPQEQIKRSFWDRLGLTDDQKEKLKQIREADRDSLVSAWAQVKIAQETLHAALLANPENTEDIQSKATNFANALSAKSVQMAMHQAKVNQVLTPAQRVAFYESIKTRFGRRNGGRESGHWQQEHWGDKRNQHPETASPAPSAGVTPEAPAH
jgi:Spy/CpxP family protein refolding chaperone